MFKNDIKYKSIISIILFAILPLIFSNITKAQNEEKIHIITVSEASTDAIILESNGKFAMIDVGEDFDYPKGDNPKYPFNNGIAVNRSYAIEDKLLSYVDRLGIKEFEFIILTHVHSDHIGNVDELLSKVKVKKVFFKEYDDSRISDKRRLFDNQYVYDKAIEAIKNTNVELIQNISISDSKFQFGDMNIQMYNYENEYDKEGKLIKHLDDNTNSILTLITAHNKKIFFGGDLDNVDGREDKYGPIIGKVDLMKFNHHFYTKINNSKSFIRTLSPKAIIKTAISDVDEDYVKWLNKYNISIVDAGRKDVEALVFKIDNNGINNITDEITQYGVLEENGKLVYRLWNGELSKPGWIKSNSKYYYVNDDYSLQTGWLNYNNDWFYFNEYGEMTTGESAKIDGEYYYFNKNGYMETLIYRDGYFYGRNGRRINDFYISKYVLIVIFIFISVVLIYCIIKLIKTFKISRSEIFKNRK